MRFYSHFSLAMDRSPGFGSAFANYAALFRLAFAPAPVLRDLNLAGCRNSPVRSTKSTRSRFNRAPSACKHRVSGSLSLPSRGPFHLSLTVLCAIGHQVVFSLGGWSPLLPAGFPVSCGTLGPALSFRISTTGLLPPLAGLSFPIRLCFRQFLPARNPTRHAPWFGLFPFRSPLLRESIFLSLPPGTEMFQFPGCPRVGLCVHPTVADLRPPGFPIRISTDLGLLAAPRGFSQLAASFVGAWCLGIHPMLFFA